MEYVLTQLPDLGYEDEPVEQVKIALTTFAFNNEEVIHLLRERGQIIKKEDWPKMEGIDNKINKLKEDNVDMFTKPVSVFISFQCEEGVNRAVNFNETVDSDPEFYKYKKWLGEYKLDIKKASEPTDIIWENRHVQPWTKTKRSIIVNIIQLILLFISFGCIFLVSK